MADEDNFVGAMEASAMLHIRPETLANWDKNGMLTGKIRVLTLPNGRKRYSAKDIEDYIEENTSDRI